MESTGYGVLCSHVNGGLYLTHHRKDRFHARAPEAHRGARDHRCRDSETDAADGPRHRLLEIHRTVHDDLQQDVIEFIEALGESYEVAVVTFSGHRCAQIVAEPTRCTEAGKRTLIDAIRLRLHVGGATVMSDGLSEALTT